MMIGISLGLTAMRGGTSAPPAAPVISITSGSGYAGSVYTSTVPGQWYADDVVISGATGATWTMTAALEGAAIRCGDSNVIQMWTPQRLTHNLWLSRRRNDVTVSADRVTSWGGLTQPAAANQPYDNLMQIGGQPTVVFGNTATAKQWLSGPILGAATTGSVILIAAPYVSASLRTFISSINKGPTDPIVPLGTSGSTNTQFIRGVGDAAEWRVNGALTAPATRGDAYTLTNSPALHEFSNLVPITAISTLGAHSLIESVYSGFAIAELIVVPAALTATERAGLASYTRGVYGLEVTA